MEREEAADCRLQLVVRDWPQSKEATNDRGRLLAIIPIGFGTGNQTGRLQGLNESQSLGMLIQVGSQFRYV